MFSVILQRSSGLANKLIACRESLKIQPFGTGNSLNRDEKKIKRSFWPWSRRRNDDKDKLKIVKPLKCDRTEHPILDPECKVAIVIGGAADIGLSAADSLLYHGARAVILADEDSRIGEKAAQNLCDFYGQKRARFFRCDPKNSCQLEGIFEEAICRYRAVHVLFSNLDRNNGKTWPGVNCEDMNNPKAGWSNTMRAIDTGVRYMSKSNGGAGGIIVNSASIIGFMGWPNDPTPVYRFKEPVAETSIDLSKKYSAETTGVRIVALLKSQKQIDEIGLPDIPVWNSNKQIDFSTYREPESRVGKALIHILTRAKTGTTWLSEPAPCLREIPRLIQFPPAEVDPVHNSPIYEYQNYKALESRCIAAPTGHCAENCGKNEKCKKFWN